MALMASVGTGGRLKAAHRERRRVIRFDRVRFRYSADAPWALDEISFEIEPGEVVALLGANGSGKSTAVRLANALLLPFSGVVTVDGVETSDPAGLRVLRGAIGVVFQRPDDAIVATAVEDDVAFGPENLGLAREEIRRRVDEALSTVGLTGFERREPHLLSGGQKQRLVIAGALAMEPRYLVFDEPTSMLDPVGRVEVLTLIDRMRDSGKGVLHVTHDLAAASTADRVMVLSAGRSVFAGTPSQLFGVGSRLAEWGLDLAPVTRLAHELAAIGAPVPAAAVRAAEVVDALCP
jgi:energy-coupling factor transport system ATP-binding protein